MKRAIVMVLLVAGCAGKSSSPGWSPQTAAELQAQTEAMFKSIDGNDIPGLKAMLDENPTVFDIDPNNQVVQFYGSADVQKYLDVYTEAAKTGMTVQSTIRRIDCRGNDTMGYCTVEFDQVFTMNGQQMGPLKFQGTLVARKVGGGWKLNHWNSSFREMPAAPAAPDSASAPH